MEVASPVTVHVHVVVVVVVFFFLSFFLSFFLHSALRTVDVVPCWSFVVPSPSSDEGLTPCG